MGEGAESGVCVCVCVMQGMLGTLKSFPSEGARRVGDEEAGWGLMPRNSGFG